MNCLLVHWEDKIISFCLCAFIYRELWMNYLCLLCMDELEISERLQKCHQILKNLWRTPLIMLFAILCGNLMIPTARGFHSVTIKSIVPTRTCSPLLYIPTKLLKRNATKRSRVAFSQVSSTLPKTSLVLWVMLVPLEKFIGLSQSSAIWLLWEHLSSITTPVHHTTWDSSIMQLHLFPVQA